MKRSIAGVLALCTILTAPEPASAKSTTVKIEIKGGGLEAPLEITDPEIVRNFSIWTGPGAGFDGQQVHLDAKNQVGMFIDWYKGMVEERPKGLQRYQVIFHQDARNEMHRAYVFTYEFDPAAAGGYIYLPGSTDAGYARNVFSIVHGIEGQWFHSTRAWEKLVRPIVEDAACDSQSAGANNKRSRRPLVSFI